MCASAAVENETVDLCFCGGASDIRDNTFFGGCCFDIFVNKKMTTQFLSRVEREVRDDSNPNVGPGGYVLPGGITRPMPGFAPFATTSSKYSVTITQLP